MLILPHELKNRSFLLNDTVNYQIKFRFMNHNEIQRPTELSKSRWKVYWFSYASTVSDTCGYSLHPPKFSLKTPSPIKCISWNFQLWQLMACAVEKQDNYDYNYQPANNTNYNPESRVPAPWNVNSNAKFCLTSCILGSRYLVPAIGFLSPSFHKGVASWTVLVRKQSKGK